VLADGCPVALGKPKQRALLAVLLLDANRVVALERLIEELWPEDPPASARHAIEVYASGLRRALGTDRIVRRAPGYLVRAEEEELDSTRFEVLAARGHKALEAGRPAAAAATFREALDLWRGAALADVAAGRLTQAAAARLDDLRIGVLEARIDADLELGHHGDVVPELEALVAEHPLRERPRRQLMLALYRSGRQADALDAYRTTRRTLLDELGLEPSRQLRDLEQAILRHDPTLEPRPTAEARSSLPSPAASFVGRRAELDALRELLSRQGVRLVTLTGPGGIGKTRLALEAARRAEREFSDGAAFVSLVPVTDERRVLEAVARGLGVRAGAGTPLLDALKGYLREKDFLLLLDNFEHVLGAGRHVSDLLAASPRLTVLATSRTPLRVYGEQELSVPPLAVRGPDVQEEAPPEAVELFVERARSVNAGFALSEQNAGAIDEICVRLDGVPLAIELAAARVKLLAPATLLARMGRRLQLLTDGPRDTPARHQTLRATIEWSHELLGEREKRLFARLSVFVGGFTLEAAEAACDATIDLLTALVDDSLVRTDGSGRFSMLDTIREYAEERLVETGDLDDVRARHAGFVVALAEEAEPELRGRDQVSWLVRLDAEEGNVLAAVDWAVEADRPDVPLRLGAALWRFWEARGSITPARERLDAALARSSDVDPEVRARALFASGRIALRQGDLDHALSVFSEGRALFVEVGDVGGEALCTAGLGWIAHVLGPVDDAVGQCREAVDLARQSGEDWIVADALNNLGVSLRTQGDLAAASTALREALALRRRIGELEGVTAALNGLALIAIATDEYAEAGALFEEAFAISRERGDLFYEAARDVVLGYLAFARGDLESTRVSCVNALESCRRHGYLQFTAYALETLAGVAAAEGNLPRAARLLGSALAISDRIGRVPVPVPRATATGVAYDWEARAVKRALAGARRDVGLRAWDELVSEGRALSLDEALAYAAEAADAAEPDTVASTVA
jgi:predicted ATPase/DNA-binding SARP family transcriptional activator